MLILKPNGTWKKIFQTMNEVTTGREAQSTRPTQKKTENSFVKGYLFIDVSSAKSTSQKIWSHARSSSRMARTNLSGPLPVHLTL